MRYVAAYLLAALGGKSSPSKSDIKAILESVGVGYDDEKAAIVCDKLDGKDINELMQLGKAKLASMPAGGAASSSAAAASSDAKDESKEEKKEEKKQESEEESDDDMGFGLFD